MRDSPFTQEKLTISQTSYFWTIIYQKMANSGKREISRTRKLNTREGFGWLGRSNWTICSPLHLSHSEDFATFSLSCWETNSYYPRGPIMGKGNSTNSNTGWDRGYSMPWAFKLDHLQPFAHFIFWKFCNFFTFILGDQFLLPHGLIMGKDNSPNFKIEWDRGFSVPGAFKLDLLQPFEQILSQKIFNFFIFILGGQFLLPQRANMKKREFIQLQNWMRQRGLSAWGIQTGPFAALWAHFALKDFSLSYWEPISYYPRGLIMEKREFIQLQNWMRHRGFSAWGIQTGTFAALWANFVLEVLQIFHFHTEEPILITPQG